MPALMTSLAGMAWVDHNHANASGFGLVDDEVLELGKRPGMQSPPLSFAALDPASDVGQVLKYDGSPGLHGLDNLLGENVVTVTAESSLPAANLAEPTLGRFGSLALTLPLLAEDPGLNVLPLSMAEKPQIAGDGGAVDAKVDTNGLFVGADLWGRKIDNDVRPPTRRLVNQVAGANFTADHWEKVIRQNERNRYPTGRGGQANRSGCPVDLERVDVVSWWAGARMRTRNLAALSGQRQCGRNGFRGLDAGLNVQVADKLGEFSLEAAVGQLVERNAVLLFRVPSDTTDDVKCRRELTGCLRESVGLLGGRIQFDSDRSMHGMSIPYALSFVNKNKDGDSAAR